jgi:hypothetical protein
MPESLDPGMVDDFLLGDLVIGNPGFGSKRDIPMNRVMSQTFGNKIAHHNLTVSIDVDYE